MKLYEWQKKVWGQWLASGMKGYFKVVTAGGKTLGGIIIIKNYLKLFPDARVIISSHRKDILKQWENKLKEVKGDIEYYTYQTLCKMKTTCDLLVCDEIHRSVSPVHIKLFENVKYKALLGMSATPNRKSDKIFENRLCDVKEGDVPTAELEVISKEINLVLSERQEYDIITRQITDTLKSETLPEEEIEEIVQSLLLKRRRVVYNALERIPEAISITNKERGNRTLLFCRKIDQANMIYDILERRGYKVGIYHSKSPNMDKQRYLDKELDVLVSCQKLLEGFDDPSTIVGIVVSFSITPTAVEQVIGRLRRKHGKDKKRIYFIVAKDTTDKYVFAKDVTQRNINFKKGTRWSWDYQGKIFKKIRGERWYHDCSIDLLSYFRKYKRTGGEFRIFNDTILIKVGKEIYEEQLPGYPIFFKKCKHKFDWVEGSSKGFCIHCGKERDLSYSGIFGKKKDKKEKIKTYVID